MRRTWTCIAFLLLAAASLFAQDENYYYYRGVDSTYSVQLRGHSSDPNTSGLTLNMTWDTDLGVWKTQVARTGLYYRYEDPNGGATFSKDSKGTLVRIGTDIGPAAYLGRIADADNDGKIDLSTAEDSSLTLQQMTTNAIAYLTQFDSTNRVGDDVTIKLTGSQYYVDTLGTWMLPVSNTRSLSNKSRLDNGPYINVADSGLYDGLDQDSLLNALFSAASNSSNNRFLIPRKEGSNIILDDTVFVTSDIEIKGEGHRGGTVIYRADNYNGPILSVGTRRVAISNIQFTDLDTTQHTDAASALVVSTSYLSHWENVWFYKARTDGLWIGNNGTTGGGSSNTFVNCNWSHMGRWGIINTSNNNNFFGGAVEYNARLTPLKGGGLLIDQDVDDWIADTTTITTTRPSSSNYYGTRFEGNGGFGVYVNKTKGVRFDGFYSTGNTFYLGDQSHHVSLTNGTLINAYIIDGGFQNTASQVLGGHTPLAVPKERYFSGNIAVNNEFTDGSSVGWTASSATVSTIFASAAGQGYQRLGRGALSVTASADTGYAYQDIPITKGGSYVVAVYFAPLDTINVTGGSRSNKVRISLADSADNTLFETGDLQGEIWTSLTEYPVETYYSFAFNDTLSTDTVRLKLKVIGNGKQALFSRVDFIPQTVVLNGAMEGTYSAGVAPQWTKNSGTGTAEEDNTKVRNGGSAQRLRGASGQNLSVRQTINTRHDANSLYLMRASVYVRTGNANAFKLGIGNAHTTDNIAVSGVLNGKWHTISKIVRPSASTVLAIGFSTLTDSLDVTVDDVQMIRLSQTPDLDIYEGTSDSLVIRNFGNTYTLPKD